MSAKEITWDLTGLFLSVNDPAVEKAITESKVLADNFEKKYRGKIGSLDPAGLLACLHEMESFYNEVGDVSLFASLSFSANMTLPEVQALYDKVSKFEAQLGKQLAFFSLELGALVKAKPEVISEPVLVNYRHMLERAQRRVPHQLSEVEEQLIIEKDQFGVQAWEELQSKWLNTVLSRWWCWARRKRSATAKQMGCCLTLIVQQGNLRTVQSTGH